jgi:deoxycytidylate deaminase
MKNDEEILKKEKNLFFRLYELANKNCLDESTIVACSLVYNNKFEEAVGSWNQLIVNYGKEYDDKILNNRELKLDKIQHAERNLIYNIVKSDQSHLKNFSNAVLYVTWIPCLECAKTIIGVGIKYVVVHEHKHTWERKEWQPIFDKSMELFNEAGVTFRLFKKKVNAITRFNKKDISV